VINFSLVVDAETARKPYPQIQVRSIKLQINSMSSNSSPDYQTPPPQPSFAGAALEPIPEDVSVKRGADGGGVNRANFSTASAVASSDDAERPGTPRSVVSDTPALLSGDEAANERRGRGRSSSGASSKKTCTKRVWIYSGMVFLLVVAVGIGIYFIVQSASDDNSEESPRIVTPAGDNSPAAAPAMETFAPFDLAFLESDAPSVAPSYNPQDMAAMKDTLSQFSAIEDLEREGTPQQQAFKWLTHQDQLELRAGVDSDVEIQQRYALCILYFSTGGDEWLDPSFLNPHLHECDWYGISCQGREVAYLDLSEQGLAGRLPSELTLLSGLAALRLYGNALSGELPSDIWSLPLIWADFSENFLRGSIPVPSARGPSIENLYLFDNAFTGTLPYFPNSQDIWASQNMFEDWDPQYASSSTLEQFAVYENDIGGQLPSTWTTENLIYLDFGINQLTGTIPVSLWRLPVLESLILHDNKFSGNLPSTTTNSIQNLWIHSNSFSGTIPATFGMQWSLTTLLLYSNDLSGQITEDHCAAWERTLDRLEADCTVECPCYTSKCYSEDFTSGSTGEGTDEGDGTVTILPINRNYLKGYLSRGGHAKDP
jgi:hypothetical protein